jgi:hypothetical protein
MDKPVNVLMTKDGQQAEVANNQSVEIMQGLGWTLFDADDKDPEGAKKLSVSDLREALTAKGIAFPEGAKKAELQALLDAA